MEDHVSYIPGDATKTITNFLNRYCQLVLNSCQQVIFYLNKLINEK